MPKDSDHTEYGLPGDDSDEAFEDDLYEDEDDDQEELDLIDERDEEESQETCSDTDDLDTEDDDDSVELTDIEDFKELEWLDPEKDFRLLGVSYGQDEESSSFDTEAFSEALADLDPDEFDPFARKKDLFGVEVDGKLTRRDRAWQIAEELSLRYAWGEDGVEILARTFTKHGWSAARIAIEREMKRGLTADELRIALEIRDLWKQNIDFAMSFSGVGNFVDRASISHRFWNMSWPCAFNLIRLFDSYPDTDEIEQLLFELHERWKSHSYLRYRFPFFYYYLIAYVSEVESTPDLQVGWLPLDDLVTNEDDDPLASAHFFEE